MQLVQPEIDVVVADDVPEWRRAIGTLVTEKCFPGRPVRVHEARNGTEALELIRTLRGNGRKPALLTDLHMSSLNPIENGAALLTHLYRLGMPNFGIISGTLSQRGKRVLSEGTNYRFVSKNAVACFASPSDRNRAARRIREIVEGDPASPVMESDIELLGELASPKFCPDKANTLVDIVKGKVANLMERYPEIAAGTTVKALLPEGLSEGRVVSNLHDYKNSLGLLLGSLVTRPEVSKGLLSEIAVFQSWLNQAYIALDREVTQTDVIEQVRNITGQLGVVAPDRIHLRILNPELTVKLPPLFVSEVLGAAIQNALVHGEGPVHVRVENSTVYIANDVPPGRQKLPFRISHNEMSGEVSEHSSSTSGSATGIRRLLQQLNAPENKGIRFAIDQMDGGLIWSEVEFDYDVVVRDLPDGFKHSVSPDVQLTLTRPNVLFMCHDNTPRSSFSWLLDVPISGVEYRLLDAPVNFDSCRISGPLRHPGVTEMMKREAGAFKAASLCVVHMTVSGFRTTLPHLHKKFPHLVLFPTSSEPDHWYNRKEETFHKIATDYLHDQILDMRAVRRYHHASDPATIGEVASQIHSYRAGREVWETLVMIAGRMVEDQNEK